MFKAGTGAEEGRLRYKDRMSTMLGMSVDMNVKGIEQRYGHKILG